MLLGKKKHYCLEALDSVICERPPVVLQAWTGFMALRLYLVASFVGSGPARHDQPAVIPWYSVSVCLEKVEGAAKLLVRVRHPELTKLCLLVNGFPLRDKPVPTLTQYH